MSYWDPEKEKYSREAWYRKYEPTGKKARLKCGHEIYKKIVCDKQHSAIVSFTARVAWPGTRVSLLYNNGFHDVVLIKARCIRFKADSVTLNGKKLSKEELDQVAQECGYKDGTGMQFVFRKYNKPYTCHLITWKKMEGSNGKK